VAFLFSDFKATFDEDVSVVIDFTVVAGLQF